MTILKNVTDKRTGLFHSVAIVDEKKVKYFASANNVAAENVAPKQTKKSTKKKG